MIKVIQPGLFTTIQDGGRHGYRNIGIPTSGFMDQESAWAANKIVDNEKIVRKRKVVSHAVASQNK